jgi:hypothetical protein
MVPLEARYSIKSRNSWRRLSRAAYRRRHGRVLSAHIAEGG